jgi:hypothetical protein
MKVKITNSVVWGGAHQEKGAILEVNAADGYWLISRGRAVAVDESAPKAENRTIEKAELSTRAPKKKPAKK